MLSSFNVQKYKKVQDTPRRSVWAKKANVSPKDLRYSSGCYWIIVYWHITDFSKYVPIVAITLLRTLFIGIKFYPSPDSTVLLYKASLP